ncbi:MAG: DNA sulfur modification protein DndB [Clostridiales bacterium]|nr:DNA sulfur modification protein DndB [Clostridiales bacterium]
MQDKIMNVHIVEKKQVGYATPSITVPAIAYYSGNRIWYAITVPYGALNMIRTSAVRKKGQEIIQSEIKNRFLDKDHKNDIKQYMIEEGAFTIPPITLVSTERLSFEPILLGASEETITVEKFYEMLKAMGSVGGVIQIPLDYQFECLDGNHRTVAIRELAEERPDITQGSNLLLNVVCEKDILKIRQDFVDVNKNAKQTTASINTLFNTRDPLPNIVSKVINEVDYLEKITDLIGTSISKNSNDVYTLNNIKNVVMEIAGYNSQAGKTTEEKVNKVLKEDEDERNTIQQNTKLFFEIIKNNPYLLGCIEDRSRAKEIRQESLLTVGVGIAIAASVAREVFVRFKGEEQRHELVKLAQYNWGRSNATFLESGIVGEQGAIANTRAIVSATKKMVARDLGYSYEE